MKETVFVNKNSGHSSRAVSISGEGIFTLIGDGVIEIRCALTAEVLQTLNEDGRNKSYAAGPGFEFDCVITDGTGLTLGHCS